MRHMPGPSLTDLWLLTITTVGHRARMPQDFRSQAWPQSCSQNKVGWMNAWGLRALCRRQSGLTSFYVWGQENVPYAPPGLRLWVCQSKWLDFVLGDTGAGRDCKLSLWKTDKPQNTDGDVFWLKRVIDGRVAQHRIILSSVLEPHVQRFL